MKSSSDDINILETILEQFIPVFTLINNIDIKNNIKTMRTIVELLSYMNKINTTNCKNKKKKYLFSKDMSLKFEEKEFLYKTYISSSDKNEENFKFFCEDSIRISNISSETIRGLLILIREEISNDNSNNILLEKFRKVKSIIITENKSFDFRFLFILLNFIILNYCENLNYVNFEGIYYNRIDQIDTMIKNGVYLYFIHKAKNITDFILTNKLEFLNENLTFKQLHEFCFKNNICDVDLDTIDFNNINAFSILTENTKINFLKISKVSIDKNSSIFYIIDVLRKSQNLKVLMIDKFVAIPEIYRKDLLNCLVNLNKLKVLKLNVNSNSNSDLVYLSIPVKNSHIEELTIKFSRNNIENKDDSHLNNFNKTNLRKLSLYFERLYSNINFANLIHQNLRKFSIGNVDDNFIREFTKLPVESILNLKKLKLTFMPLSDEQHENVYQSILTILSNFKFIRKFKFENFVIKYKNICDDQLRNILKESLCIKKLIISSDTPFRVQYIEGLYYYEYSKAIINPMLFSLKKNPITSRIYKKKSIISRILDFHQIRKEKVIVISYKI